MCGPEPALQQPCPFPGLDTGAGQCLVPSHSARRAFRSKARDGQPAGVLGGHVFQTRVRRASSGLPLAELC